MSEAIQNLERFVGANVRARGSRYFAQRRVEIRRRDPVVEARVIGSRRYTVVLTRQGDALVGACTCEFFELEFEPCKHIWATVLALEERSASAIRGARRLLVDEDLLEDVEVDDEETEGPPTDGPKAPWRSFFHTLESRARYDLLPSVTAELPVEIRYVIDPTRYSGQGAAIDVYARFPKKSGEPGALRKSRLVPSVIERLADPDRELVSFLYSPFDMPGLDSMKLRVLLPRLAATERLYIVSAPNQFAGPLRYDDRVFEFRVVVEPRGDSYRINGMFVHEDEQVEVGSVDHLIGYEWFISGERLARFEGRADAWLQALHSHGVVTVPKTATAELAASLAASPRTRIEAPPELQVIDVEPRPKLRLEREHGDSWKASLRVVYGDEEIDPQTKQTSAHGGRHIRRRFDVEHELTNQLTLVGFRGWGSSEYHIPDRDLAAALIRLADDGWELDIAGESFYSGGELELEISSGIDWFDLNGGLTFGDRSVGLPELLESIRRKESLVRLEGGGVAYISPEWREQLESVAATGSQAEAGMRFTRAQITLLDALLMKRDVSVDRDYERLRATLEKSQTVGPRSAPQGFGTELRPYQQLGLGWLHFLREVRFGGCLADDMGLGKTVQALALLEDIRLEGNARGPSLIVAPRSLIFNWKAEAARFAPKLRVLDHHGIDRVRGSEHFADYDLILTTYATLQRDIAHLAPIDLEYVILDEAQAIKNASSQSAKAVKTLRANHRLALSGTPIENHLGELWSLFDFLNPGMLGPARNFGRTFGAKSAPPEAREKLAKIVAPFVLRRTKQMVLPDLPEKDEQTLWVELSEKERHDYDELREHYRQLLLQRVAENGMAKSKMHVLEALLRLRQAALHAGLLDPKRREETSAKLEALEAELAILADSDHKALVFSQFTGLLDIVQQRLDEKGIGYVRLDGSTRNREEIVQQFQENEWVRVFLISLKAGGVGLNLTAADYVYLLDPWWNPAVEAQAVDRAHRIGQARKVTATRIVASDTVEEKILQLQSHKRALADSIIRADEGLLRTLDLSDLEMLLS